MSMGCNKITEEEKKNYTAQRIDYGIGLCLLATYYILYQCINLLVSHDYLFCLFAYYYRLQMKS